VGRIRETGVSRAGSRRGDGPAAPPPGYPATYRPVTRGPGIDQDDVFDPSLKHFLNAFRPGAPVFADAEAGHRWRRARRRALDHVLATIAGTRVAGQVVLRGSVLLRAWFGDAAREPGDIDLVVTPPDIAMDSPDGRRLVNTITGAVTHHPPPDGLTFDDTAAVEDIWTYERAPGRRLVFCWHADGVPDGTVQVDVVFGEPLPQEPVPTPLPTTDGATVALLAATPELSLAWKLLWLETDNYPQGKDLYDAVLLAENCHLPRDLLTTVLARELGDGADRFRPGRVARWRVDRTGLRDEHPGIDIDTETWKHRLERALTATFE
jgi:hypothetical protein